MRLKLKHIIAVLVLLGAVYGCIKKKTYTVSPEIQYKSFVITDNQNDKADISITFTDGDGDIGREPSDSSKADYNIFITYYYFDPSLNKFTALYDPNIKDTSRLPGYIRRPADYQPGKPISGEVTENILYRHSVTVKRLKYVIYISDNAGHKSNVITTPEITVP